MKTLFAALVIGLALSAAACGKKPGTLQPEDPNVTFPRTYPTR